MEVVCIDSQILIHGRRSMDRGKHMTERDEQVELFLNWVENEEQKAQRDSRHVSAAPKLMVPTPAITEYLVGVRDIAKHGRVLEELQRYFFVYPFDAAAALFAARMQIEKQGVYVALVNELMSTAQVSREEATSILKVDMQIVAIARVHGADRVYSWDSQMTRLAEGYIAVEPIPPQVHQGSLL